MDLHIGVTDSSGNVIEFDKSGLQRRNAKKWNQCLILDQVSEEDTDLWDQTLARIIREGCWSAKK